jgi:outer membrane protein insertion porin family
MVLFNNKFISIFCLLILFISNYKSYAQENYEVTDVSFDGNETLDTETLENTIALKSTGWFSKNILRNEAFLFSSEILKSDVDNVKRLYQREGFLFIRVVPELISDDVSKEVDVIFKVYEGPPIIVDTVIINKNVIGDESGLKIDSLISLTYNNLTLKSGERFRDEDIRKDETKLIKIYLDNGYPHTDINFDLKVDTTNCLVSIYYYIESGVLSKFGRTSISGLDYYSRTFISSKFKYSEGERFNAEKLDNTQKRLVDLGIFYGVSFKSVLVGASPEVVPLELSIKEAKRFKTTLGVGYGRDEKFRVALDLTLIGIFKGPGRMNFEAKSSAIEKFSLKLGYSHPEFLWEKATFRLQTNVAKVDELPYKENSQSLNLGILGNISRNFFSLINYNLEHISLDVSSIAIQEDTTQVKDNYIKSGINFLVSYINAEPFTSPENGFNISLSAAYSGIGFGSHYRFLKSILDLRNYTPVSNSMIAGIRLSVGYLESFNQPGFIPVEERYYLGGSNSVRGWARFELGPSDINGKPKGGNSFLEGSIEIRYPYIEKIYGVLFLDYGNVWESTLTYRINELQYSAGIGIRYSTPVGPLRFDISRPIFNSKKKIQLWFSIGHTF